MTVNPRSPSAGESRRSSPGGPRSPKPAPRAFSLHDGCDLNLDSTPGAQPDGPRDLLADAAEDRALAEHYAYLGFHRVAEALHRSADRAEEMHELIKSHQGGEGANMEQEFHYGMNLFNHATRENIQTTLFSMGQEVSLVHSEERGKIIGVFFNEGYPVRYQVRYKNAGGEQVECTWDEEALKA